MPRKEYETEGTKMFLQDCRGFEVLDDVNEKTVRVIFETKPCRHLVKLEDDKYGCAIYNQRPKICREYPSSLAETLPGCVYRDTPEAFRHSDKRWYTKGVPENRGD